MQVYTQPSHINQAPVKIFEIITTKVFWLMHAMLHVYLHIAHTLIFIMIGFFLAKKENILVPNAVEKHRTGAFRTREQTMGFFFSLKKRDNHYENESIS
jgi:hypothetical protein